MTRSATVHPLEDFHRFIADQLKQSATGWISPEEALALWHERQETIAAVREGLADIDAGRTWPAEEVIRELRAGLPQS